MPQWAAPLLPCLLLCLLRAAPCAGDDPFSMFESDAPAPADAACCQAAGQCGRQLASYSAHLVALRVRWRRAVTPPPPPPKTTTTRGAGAARRAERARLDSAFMRRHVARTLRLLRLHELDEPAERETLLLRATVSELQVLQMRQFLAGGDVSLVEVDDILEAVLSAADAETLSTEGAPRWLRRLGRHVTLELVLALAAAAPAAWLVWALLAGRSWSHIGSRLAVLAVAASVLWHWQQLYGRELARRHADLAQRAPERCSGRPVGLLEAIGLRLFGLVSWASADECQRHARVLMVDPFWQVSPAMALSETLAALLLQPAERLGGAFGRFGGALAAEVPALWLPLMLPISLATVLASVAIMCRGLAALRVAAVAAPPLHVCVSPGDEDVHLLVTADHGLAVRPLGSAARRRTLISGQDGGGQLGWLRWAAGGVWWAASSLAGGTVRLALRHAPTGLAERPAPPALRLTDRVQEPAGSTVAVPGPLWVSGRVEGAGAAPQPARRVGPAAVESSSDSAMSPKEASPPYGRPRAASEAGGGGDGGGGSPPGERVECVDDRGDSSPVPACRGQAGGGVAPAADGDGSFASACDPPPPPSPFLDRIKQVMTE